MEPRLLSRVENLAQSIELHIASASAASASSADWATAKLLVKSQPEGGGELTVNFHAIGDSSHCPYLAKARGTSAGKS